MPNSLKSAALVLCLAILAGIAFAAETASGQDAISIPNLINFQGKLTDASGNPRNGPFSMTFRIYDVASGGTHLWQETQATVQVTDGLFNVLLGSVTPILPGTNLPDGPNCWFEVEVGGEIVTPRTRMVSAPYAYNTDDAAKLGGVPAANHITTATAAGGDLTGNYPGPTIAQKGATSGQVLKWSGAAWLPAEDLQGSGGGGVTQVNQGTGITLTPNPITTTGTVAFNETYGDARYVNEGQTAGGDLAGTYPNPTVDGLQGRAVAATAPTDGQILRYTTSGGGSWLPADDWVGLHEYWSFDLDLTSMAANSINTWTISFAPGTGPEPGDIVLLAHPITNWSALLVCMANCEAGPLADQLRFRVWNISGGAIDPPSCTWYMLWMHGEDKQPTAGGELKVVGIQAETLSLTQTEEH